MALKDTLKRAATCAAFVVTGMSSVLAGSTGMSTLTPEASAPKKVWVKDDSSLQKRPYRAFVNRGRIKGSSEYKKTDGFKVASTEKLQPFFLQCDEETAEKYILKGPSYVSSYETYTNSSEQIYTGETFRSRIFQEDISNCTVTQTEQGPVAIISFLSTKSNRSKANDESRRETKDDFCEVGVSLNDPAAKVALQEWIHETKAMNPDNKAMAQCEASFTKALTNLQEETNVKVPQSNMQHMLYQRQAGR